ncbi:MAG TPA: glycosyltransferase family 4 protein [Thermoanaerobaculia bacterium]|nr:glycosyltransferase family 4 protein [Thermoanaerobaculia bacterium]
MTAPLRIAYLMEDTDLSGGVRVQLAQADAMIARGHRVTIFTKGLPLTWRTSEAEWEYVDDFRAQAYDEFDFVIATFWTTVEPAFEKAGKRAVHLSQGLESTFTAYQAIREDIERAYRLPIPKIVVSPHLIDWLAPFGQEIFVVGQIVDEAFFRERRPEEHEPLRVLLAGASQVDFKGIDVGYDAVLHARAAGSDLALVRVSPWAPSREEPKEAADEFHVGLDAAAMVRLVHSCDVFLGPSRKEEGFGLPAAEAMAAGIPAVLSRIPSFESFEPHRSDYAVWAEEGDPEALGDALMRLLDDPDLREALSIRGRQVAKQYRAANVAERLEAFLLERRSRAQAK